MNPINHKRLYEITGLHDADAYKSSEKDWVGTIIRSDKSLRYSFQPGFYTGGFTIIKSQLHVQHGYFHAATLRPLTQKEQEKINGAG